MQKLHMFSQPRMIELRSEEEGRRRRGQRRGRAGKDVRQWKEKDKEGTGKEGTKREEAGWGRRGEEG